MTTQKKIGASGLSVPVIKDSSDSRAKIDSSWVSKWRAALPLADTGVAAKKTFQLLTELNNIPLPTEERFSIMEQIHEPLDHICSALKKHFVEQKRPLDQNKVLIANLRQALLNEFIDNYKTIVEELYNKYNDSANTKKIFIISLARLLHYANTILVGRYQLYSNAPAGLWKEIGTLYKIINTKKLLTEKIGNKTLGNYFVHILILACTDPYHWRQKEQLYLNDCISKWEDNGVLLSLDQIAAKPGIYTFDLDQDTPPNSIVYKKETSSSCIVLDISKNITHLQELIATMKSGGLKAKIAHTGDPEYNLDLSGLIKLLNIWSQKITRNSTRFPIDAEIRIAFGITAAHYYINDEEEFDSHPKNLIKEHSERESTNVTSLPTFEVSDDEEVEEELIQPKIPNDVIKPTKSIEDSVLDTHAEYLYTIYEYHIENISNNGLCVMVRDQSFPPFQCGEIVAYKNLSNNDPEWSIGAVRWLKRNANGQFQIGIQLISPIAKAAGIQFMRDDKPLGQLQRCLVLPAMPDLNLPQMLITATMPLHSKKVVLYIEGAEGIPATLGDEIDSSGMYYQYSYSATEKIEIKSKQEEEKEKVEEKKKDNSEFESIWDRL